MKTKGILNANLHITKDDSGNAIINGCVAAEHLEEVIKILEDCDAKLKATIYYKTVYNSDVKGIRNTDPVLKTEFEVRSSADFLKLILARIEEN